MLDSRLSFIETIFESEYETYSGSHLTFHYDDATLTFEGSDLQYEFENGEIYGISSGTIERVTVTLADGRTVFDASNIGASAQILSNHINSNSSTAAFNVLLHGNDGISGADGNDKLAGFLGNDTLVGHSGNDRLFGEHGNDSLNGGSGADLLNGGNGRDRLTGGSGIDQFVFRSTSDSSASAASADVITDFVRGTDKMSLSAIDALVSTATNNAFVWRGTSSFSSTTAGEVRYKKYNNAGTSNDYTMVFVDNDADTAVEMAIRVNGLHNFTSSDFIL